MTAASDMDCLPAQGKIQSKCRPASGMALHANLARMLLDDSVCDGKTQPSAAALAFAGSRLGRKKRIVNALNVLRRNTRSRVGHPHTEICAIGGRHAQGAASGHGVL